MQPNWSQTLTGASIGTFWCGSIINLSLFETITSWMVSASRSSHPNLRRRDPKLSSQEHFKMVHSFTTVRERDHYAKPSDSTSSASHFPSLFYMGVWKSRKWKWNGNWKRKLEMENGNGNWKRKSKSGWSLSCPNPMRVVACCC